MPEKKDYYEVLGVERSADESDLKRAYRKLAKQYHPDMNTDNKEAEYKFKEISEAYAVLSDPQKKQQYDNYGHAAFDGAGFGGFGGFDFGFEDIFDSFFGGSPFGGRSTRGRSGPRKGADLQYSIEISFIEAAFGAKRDINVSRMQSCKDCDGSGSKPGTSPETCKHCNGSGQIRRVQSTMFGQMVNMSTCEICRGEGKVITEPCETCHGNGRTKKTSKISINIPAGIDNGQTISLRGEGESGIKGGPAGDLYVSIRVKSHPIFKREGYNVICEIPITFTQAALGAELDVPTIEGTIKYTIPEGTQTGTVFKLRNKGIKYLNSNAKGDQFIKINVDVPTKLSDKQKELLREFAEISGDEVFEQRKGFFDKMKNLFQ